MRNRTLGVLGVVVVHAGGAYVAACGGGSPNKGSASGDASVASDGSGGEDSAQVRPDGSAAGDSSIGNPLGDAQSPSDAPSNADSTAVVDASDGGVEAAALCNASKAFAAVGEITSLDVTDAAAISARGARLGPDLTTMYFGWNDILYTGDGTQTQSVNAIFTGLAPIPILADMADGATLAQNEPTLTPDGLTLYYANNGRDVWVSTRLAGTSPWSTPQPASALASTFATVSPYVQGDGSYLYFSSTRTKASGDAGVDAGPFNLGGYDIYRVPLSAGQPSGPIEHVPELSTPGDDLSPVVTPDGKTIYFSRGVGSDGGATFRQIWTATRATVPGPFGTPSIVAELEHDSATTDPTWISPGNCTLYFASFRGTEESGGERVFVATRPAQ